MRGEQSWGMHVKWGDGGDLVKAGVKDAFRDAFSGCGLR